MDDFLIDLGARIRGFRKAKALTQAELAEKAGLHVTYVSDIERGMARNVSVVALYSIAQALEIHMTSFFHLPEQDQDLQEMIAECLGKLQKQGGKKQVFVLNVMGNMLEEIKKV